MDCLLTDFSGAMLIYTSGGSVPLSLIMASKRKWEMWWGFFFFFWHVEHTLSSMMLHLKGRLMTCLSLY